MQQHDTETSQTMRGQTCATATPSRERKARTSLREPPSGAPIQEMQKSLNGNGHHRVSGDRRSPLAYSCSHIIRTARVKSVSEEHGRK